MLSQSQELRQEQILTPQQIQSLEILTAPLLELQARISQELEQNPVLEQEKPSGEELAGDIISNAEEEEASEERKDPPDERDEKLDQLISIADEWKDMLPPFHARRIFTPEDEEKHQHFLESVTRVPSLQENLIEQLRFADCDEKTRQLAELVIGSIDESGYLASNIADLSTASGASEAEILKALSLVQTFDPPGIGARDIKECLMLQLKALGRRNSPAARIVENHLDDLAANRIPLIARKTGLSIDTVHSAVDEIKTLSVHPGTALAADNPVYIIPEITVEKRDGAYTVVPRNENFPRVRLSEFYIKKLDDPMVSKEDKEYIRDKLGQAKMLIKSLEQRKDTLVRISEIIVDTQQDFFDKGSEHLHPLTMQQVADKLGVHETTVSRAIANKFIQTPAGLRPLKFFFSAGFTSSAGEQIANKSVMEKIRDMIAKEDTSNPLSDQEITEILNKEGIPVARRTVAKYRDELKIAPARLRREFR